MRVYFAASLFTQVERQWNRHLSEAITRLQPKIDFIMPQDFKTAGKYNDSKHYGALYRMCVDGINASDAVLAILDGAEVDSGVAWEVGYATAKGIPVVGVRTDFRPGAEHGLNIMLSRSCRYLVREFSFQEEVDPLAKAILRRLSKFGNKG